MLTINLNRPIFSAHCDLGIVKAYIDGPNCLIMLGLDDVESHVLCQVEYHDFTIFIADVEMSAGSVELHGPHWSRQRFVISCLISRLHVPEDYLPV